MVESIIATPKTADELAIRLEDDSWCASYAFRIRWPHGFVCLTCGAFHPESEFQIKPLCRACGRCSSITAGTLLHGSKKSLSTWLRALWWASGESSSISIMKLKNYLGFSSYQTGWAWMKKLRHAIELVNRKKCTGITLVDSAPAEVQGQGEQLLVAVESIARGRTTGRLRMKLCRSLDQELISRFCRAGVTAGSIIVFPGRKPFTSVHLQEMLYTVDDASLFHEDIDTICTSYRRWRRREKYSWSHLRCSQNLVEEFCFFHNGALTAGRVDIFETLVLAALTHQPADFDGLKEMPAHSGDAP
ncbi:MAG: hypothetical protein ACR2PB_02525 [Desulfocapsaceae bacterium]